MHKHWLRAPLWWLPGALAAALIVALLVLPLWAFGQYFNGADGWAVLGDRYTWRVLRFSAWQAALSTLLSVGLALPMACALSRRGAFRGRDLCLRLFSIPLVMPTLVAIVGLVAVYGQRGWLRQSLEALLGEPVSLPFYGLTAILLAHVFLNFPLATRVFLQRLSQVPEQQWRIASQLGLGAWAQFRYLEWPATRRALRQVSALVFCLCFTSFAVVLTLGGGPKATTLEVAVYQALRLDFDIPTAVTLALLQLLSSALVMALLWRSQQSVRHQTHLLPSQRMPVGHAGLQWAGIALGLCFVIFPLVAVLLRALPGFSWAFLADPALWRAIANTLLAGFGAGTLSVMLALGLLTSSRHLSVRLQRHGAAKGLEALGNALLLMPSVVLSAGLFLMLRRYADLLSVGLAVVVVINALMALPFALSLLHEPWMNSAQRADRLCASLGMGGAERWRWVEWPAIRQAVGTALGMCSAMAAGDLTAIALFGHRDLLTLPLLLYQRLGSYRLAEAAATALVLLLTCLLMFYCAERGVLGRRVKA